MTGRFLADVDVTTFGADPCSFRVLTLKDCAFLDVRLQAVVALLMMFFDGGDHTEEVWRYA